MNNYNMEHQDSISAHKLRQAINDVEEQKIITLKNFVILNVITFGLYSAWWVYKTWRFFKQKENTNIFPVPRTIFSVFFLIPLYNKILSFAKEKGYIYNFSSTALYAAGFVVELCAGSLPAPFWLISIFSFVFLIPPFNALNYANRNSSDFLVTEQPSFSRRQMILIFAGMILWGYLLTDITGLKPQW